MKAGRQYALFQGLLVSIMNMNQAEDKTSFDEMSHKFAELSSKY